MKLGPGSAKNENVPGREGAEVKPGSSLNGGSNTPTEDIQGYV
jgi:hypothetical protein